MQAANPSKKKENRLGSILKRYGGTFLGGMLTGAFLNQRYNDYKERRQRLEDFRARFQDLPSQYESPFV